MKTPVCGGLLTLAFTRPLEAIQNAFPFENLNARSKLRNPLRRTSEWPRRLLHTANMRSDEKTKNASYGSLQEPTYNILSYTWGHFTNANGCALEIRNITWEVPRVDVNHFTAAQFQAVIHSLTDPKFPGKDVNESGGEINRDDFKTGKRKAVDYIWLDVACIDQGTSIQSKRERLEEINNQAVIFGRAETAYVWLSHHRLDVLTPLLLQMGQCVRSLEQSLHSTPTRSPSANGQLTSTWLDFATTSIEKLLSDPWFMSLWTLQEAFLRQDALILSLEAQPVPLDPETRNVLGKLIRHRAEQVCRDDYDIHESATCGTYWTVSTLAAALSLMHRLLLSLLLDESFSASGALYSKTLNLFSILRGSSLCYFDTTNEFALYHATKFRRPQIQFDLVYGCMQIFNVHLGKPERLFMESESLDELSDGLVVWLTNRHGFSSQMFVHTKPAAVGKSWRFSLNSEVTDDFMPSMFRSNEIYMNFWVAYAHSWGLRFFGIAYDFVSLAERWSTTSSTNPPVSELEARLFLHMPAVGPLKSIAMDESMHLEGMPSRLKGLRLHIRERAALVGWLVKYLAETNDLRVLLLGHFMDNLWLHSNGPIFYCMGIIVIQKHDKEHGHYWQRLGLCLWESNLLPLRNECRPGQWEHIDGLYG